MASYDEIRESYKPAKVKFLLIAESPPPFADAGGSRHFYRTDRIRPEDRLFLNTMRALYAEAVERTDTELEEDKESWLRRFQSDGWYMIKALETSMEHEVTKKQRQENIREALPRLIERVGELADDKTKVILIKSNVFEVVAEPLRQAGFNVLNKELLDYPGRFNQRAYRAKLSSMVGNK